MAELIKMHEGTVSVKSKAGEGSTFNVSLPLGRAPESAVQVSAARSLQPVASRTFVNESAGWLPKAGLTPTGGEAPMSEEGAWRLMAAETPETVLFADDNADMREYVSRLLKSRYWVTTALNGREALSKALATAPDLVLVDVMMPETDGFELVQSLRSQPSTKNVRPNKTKGRPDFRAKRRFNAYSDGVVENHKKTVQSVAWIGSLTSYRFDQGIAGY